MAVVSFRKGRTCTNYLWANTKNTETNRTEIWVVVSSSPLHRGWPTTDPSRILRWHEPKLPIWQQLKTLLGSQTWSLDGSSCPLSMSQNLQLPEFMQGTAAWQSMGPLPELAAALLWLTQTSHIVANWISKLSKWNHSKHKHLPSPLVYNVSIWRSGLWCPWQNTSELPMRSWICQRREYRKIIRHIKWLHGCKGRIISAFWKVVLYVHDFLSPSDLWYILLTVFKRKTTNKG